MLLPVVWSTLVAYYERHGLPQVYSNSYPQGRVVIGIESVDIEFDDYLTLGELSLWKEQI